MPRDTEVTGPTTVDLWAQSSAPDTDFTAKLTVVKPDGEVVNLNDGILRTSFRDSLSDADAGARPTSRTEYRIADLADQLRVPRRATGSGVEISSSDYPQFAPEPQHR